jgi:hypothetical protein
LFPKPNSIVVLRVVIIAVLNVHLHHCTLLHFDKISSGDTEMNTYQFTTISKPFFEDYISKKQGSDDPFEVLNFSTVFS